MGCRLLALKSLDLVELILFDKMNEYTFSHPFFEVSWSTNTSPKYLKIKTIHSNEINEIMDYFLKELIKSKTKKKDMKKAEKIVEGCTFSRDISKSPKKRGPASENRESLRLPKVDPKMNETNRSPSKIRPTDDPDIHVCNEGRTFKF
eukprot:TRINITY_DN6477_c0_g1_i1.p1 TRINITY_DN6477_c0_g1~~TRINITY_DN6477_c0_g1_i1.p1  ORF type:complete len:148 (+),score=36.80 TRINITY_DN6477_c0_g1_i1:141-584(+)